MPLKLAAHHDIGMPPGSLADFCRQGFLQGSPVNGAQYFQRAFRIPASDFSGALDARLHEVGVGLEIPAEPTCILAHRPSAAVGRPHSNTSTPPATLSFAGISPPSAVIHPM
jgi:hypothetical protein